MRVCHTRGEKHTYVIQNSKEGRSSLFKILVYKQSEEKAAGQYIGGFLSYYLDNQRSFPSGLVWLSGLGVVLQTERLLV